MLTRARAQLGNAAIGGVLATIIAFTAFGTGYRATRIAQHDGSATLAKGHTIVHVNGETGKPDAEVAREMATGRQRLEVVQTRSGAVYVVNTTTGVVTSIDTTTMQPGAKRKPSGRPSAVQVVTGGHDTYVVDRQRGRVDLVDPKTLTTRRSLSVGAGIQDAVVDGGGTAWVLGRDGQVRRIVDGQQREVIPAGGGDSKLTLVGDRPTVVDADAGVARPLGGGQPQRALRLPIPQGARIEVGAPSAAGSTAWVVDEDSGELVRAPLDGGAVRTGPLGDPQGAADFGPPVADSGRVYVPDYKRRVVEVMDADSLRLRARVPVPGNSDTFDVFVRNGKVWINDPYAREAVVIGPDGHRVRVDKGSGHAVISSAQSAEQRPSQPRSPSTSPPRSAPEPVPAPAPPAGPTPGTRPPSTRPPATQPPPTSEPLIPVPPVVGMQHDQACDRLVAAGLNCRLIPVPTAPGRKPGEVVSTDPKAGERVRRATRVIAEWLQPPAAPPQIATPAVVGHNITDACAILRQAGLECDAIDLGPVNGQPQNAFVVVDQTPAPSTAVAPGTHVQIRHYGNPVVPDVRGQQRDQACASLAAAHLQCQQVPGDAPVRPDIVYDQTQPPGAGVAEGTAVQVLYEDTPLAAVERLKRSGHQVWVITTDPAHANELQAARYVDRVTIGQAFAPTTAVTGTLKPLYGYRNSKESLGGDNLQYSDDPNLSARDPDWRPEGVALVVFNQPYAGTVALQRLHRASDDTFVYATSQGDISFYNGAGYTDPVVLGWVWPP